MKKIIIRFFIIVTTLFYFQSLHAQCTISDLAVELKSAVSGPSGCKVTFDFTWKQEVNGGNKFAYIHFWRADQYPYLKENGLAYTNTEDFPDASDLSQAFATMVIEGNGTDNPVIGMHYYPAITVPVLYEGLSVYKEKINAVSERMTIKNINVTLPGCNGTSITGDIWASQSENGKNVHCVSSGVSFVIGNPVVSGLLYCTQPRQYSVLIRNTGVAGLTMQYNMYIDEGDGIYEPEVHDLKITDQPIGPIILAPGNNYQSGIQSYLPYSAEQPYSDRNLWVEVITQGINNKTISFITNSCSPLPVQLRTFDAVRKQTAVTLSWSTSSEMENKGFEIQKKTANGVFQPLAFVFSKAEYGNSQSTLEYNFTDWNDNTTATFYRLKQVDLNGHFSLSETKAVAGLFKPETFIIYPNPSSSGKVEIVLFGNNTFRNIALFDITGRQLKNWLNYTSNTLTLNGLLAGIYCIRVTNSNSGEQMTEKFIITAN